MEIQQFLMLQRATMRQIVRLLWQLFALKRYQIVATGGVACAHCPALINTEQCSRIFCVRELQRVLPSVANFWYSKLFQFSPPQYYVECKIKKLKYWKELCGPLPTVLVYTRTHFRCHEKNQSTMTTFAFFSAIHKLCEVRTGKCRLSCLTLSFWFLCNVHGPLGEFG